MNRKYSRPRQSDGDSPRASKKWQWNYQHHTNYKKKPPSSVALLLRQWFRDYGGAEAFDEFNQQGDNDGPLSAGG